MAPRQRKPKRLLFRIFYSTTFSIFFLILIALSITSPTDAVWEAYKNGRPFDIFIIAGVYVLTGVVAVLILASRLYTNRAVLLGIPKTYIPIEPEDLGKRVRKLIKDGLDRTAIIAYNARPKVLPDDNRGIPHLISRLSTSSSESQRQIREKAQNEWNKISHPGWSSPCSPDLPDLQYEPIIEELPALIEARAVSLAPADPDYAVDPLAPSTEPFNNISTPGNPVVPDARVVDVLQRADTMGLRDYLTHLTSLNLINPPMLGSQFLSLYEKARFSTRPLTDLEFRRLMSTFAEMLRGMRRLDPDLIAEIQNVDPLAQPADNYDSDGINELDDGLETPTPASEHSSSDAHSVSSLSTTASTGTQQKHRVPNPSRRDPSFHSFITDSTRSLRTAPQTQNQRSRSYLQNSSRSSRGPSSRPNMTSRLPSGTSLRQTRSNVSVTSKSSAASGRSGGSVIRLAGAGDGRLDLPYVIDLDG